MAAYERAMAKWGLFVEGGPLSLIDTFDAAGEAAGDAVGDLVLDIGFGGGDALIEVAELRPTERVIGIDVHTPGIATVLNAIERRGLRNVRVVEGDVIDFAPRVPAGSLAAIRIFFPDPWPKHRQRNRRLIRPDVVERLVPLLRTGGVLHMVTDDAGYALQMRRICDLQPALSGGVIERPSWRPTTRYEQRAIDEGRRPVDLLYTCLPYTGSDSSPSASSSA
jgi:tRNA (guanine-N7-)-methyltransferase